jgi:hypothetical protein
MLNEIYRITPKDSKNCNIHWNAPSANDVSWIYINGEYVLGPILIRKKERIVKIPFATNDVIKIEVHDLPNNITINAIEITPNIKPVLIWNSTPEAIRYRIYHLESGKIENIIYDRKATDGIDRYVINCPITLNGKGGVWHFFRVEAVDLYGNESTRQNWSFFVMDTPLEPSDLAISNGSLPGTFNFLITI